LNNFEVVSQVTYNDDFAYFKIAIVKTHDGIKMKSHEGSVWQELGFSTPQYKSHAIDKFGMKYQSSDGNEKKSVKEDYLFSISKTNYGIELKGIKGTAWKELKFTLSEGTAQLIDNYGMVMRNN
jgi:hypothetical protein